MFKFHSSPLIVFSFFLNDTAPPEISTLPLHDALPISAEFPPRLGAAQPLVERIAPRPFAEFGRDRIGRDDLRLPISGAEALREGLCARPAAERRSEEHTSELQSPDHLLCRPLLEKKKT